MRCFGGFFPGGGGSPPGGAQQAMMDATRLNLWKLYNQGMGGGGGLPAAVMGNSMGPNMLPPHEDDRNQLQHHMPILPPHPPQREALNLDVKDEVRT